MGYSTNKQSFKIYCKTDPSFCLAIRDGNAILAPSNPSDPLQHWYKDEEYSKTVKGDEGVSSFVLINKATGQAIKHSPGADRPVQLVTYNQNVLEMSVLWSEANDADSGYISIRTVASTSLYLDAQSGHVEDGTFVTLWPRNHADNQWWKIEPYSAFKVYCKDGPNFSLTIRDGKVVLAPSNPNDEFQHWYKDEKYSSKVKDAYGFPSFSLINKATGEAIKHPDASSQPVRLIPYNPNVVDKSILWTLGEILGDGYSAIRMVNDTSLNFDARDGHAGDGIDLICYPWGGGDNQRWIIEPYSTFKVYCKAGRNFSLTIRDDKVILAPSNPKDEFQHWYKDERYGHEVKDPSGFPSFSLINKATGQAIKHPVASSQPVQLTPYNPSVLDKSILWTEDGNLGDGYRAIRMVNNISLNFDARDGYARDGVDLICYPWHGTDNQRWIVEPHSTFIIYCKGGTNLSLTIRNGKVILAPSNPHDKFQHWYIDRKYGNEMKDASGLPSYSLINKATGEAIKHPAASSQPVQLTPYNPSALDESVLWTEHGNLGDGYRAIRMVNNISLNFDAKDYAQDGVDLICYPWHGSDNQQWNIAAIGYV